MFRYDDRKRGRVLRGLAARRAILSRLPGVPPVLQGEDGELAPAGDDLAFGVGVTVEVDESPNPSDRSAVGRETAADGRGLGQVVKQASGCGPSPNARIGSHALPVRSSALRLLFVLTVSIFSLGPIPVRA